jgi:peptidoglycan/LPS O-acetylase OafA/YrhL
MFESREIFLGCIRVIFSFYEPFLSSSAGNNVTFLNPKKDLYSCSPVLSSIFCMCFHSLSSSFSYFPSADLLGKYFMQWLNNSSFELYNYHLPSLSSLSKYWCDPDCKCSFCINNIFDS